MERVPDPHAEIFEAGLREPGDVVQHAMVERLADLARRTLDASEVGNESRCRVGLAAERDLDLERMAVDAAIGMAFGIGVEVVRGVETEAVRELHGLADADDLVGLQRQSPARVREAIVDGGSRMRFAPGSIHRLQEEMPEGE